MARQNRTNTRYWRDKTDKAQRFKIMRRNFWHCRHWFSPTYNSSPSAIDAIMVRVYLRSNSVEMEYDKARIELEGPESKKWPGADWVEEGQTDSWDTESTGQVGHTGNNREGTRRKTSP